MRLTHLADGAAFASYIRLVDILSTFYTEGRIKRVGGGGGDHRSRSATFAARERERNVVELCLRGATFEQVGRQLNIERSTAYQGLAGECSSGCPRPTVETLRKTQSERLQRMRGKLWTEIAGRAARTIRSKVIAPSPELPQ